MEIVAQQWVSGNEVAIVRTIEPLSAAFLSFWLLRETFNFYDYLGSGIVLSAIILLLVSQGRKLEDSISSALAKSQILSASETGSKPSPQP